MKTTLLLTVLLGITTIAFGQQQTVHQTERTSVSITNSDYNYALNASFNQQKEEAINALVIKTLGQPTTTTATEKKWISNDIYSVSLTAEKINIELDKDKAAGAVYRLFTQLGQDIQNKLTASTVTKVKH